MRCSYLVEVEHEVQLTHVVEILVQHLTGKRGTVPKKKMQSQQSSLKIT